MWEPSGTLDPCASLEPGPNGRLADPGRVYMIQILRSMKLMSASPASFHPLLVVFLKLLALKLLQLCKYSETFHF